MLYRAADKPNAELGGRKLTYRIVGDDAVEAAEAEGWFRSPDDAEGSKAESPSEADPILKLLDENAATIIENIPALTPDEIGRLIAAEQAGKTRKGVIKALEEAVKDPAP